MEWRVSAFFTVMGIAAAIAKAAQQTQIQGEPFLERSEPKVSPSWEAALMLMGQMRGFLTRSPAVQQLRTGGAVLCRSHCVRKQLSVASKHFVV